MTKHPWVQSTGKEKKRKEKRREEKSTYDKYRQNILIMQLAESVDMEPTDTGLTICIT